MASYTKKPSIDGFFQLKEKQFPNDFTLFCKTDVDLIYFMIYNRIIKTSLEVGQ